MEWEYCWWHKLSNKRGRGKVIAPTRQAFLAKLAEWTRQGTVVTGSPTWVYWEC
jgi:hypothetical protein